jgi:hypothetical protein
VRYKERGGEKKKSERERGIFYGRKAGWKKGGMPQTRHVKRAERRGGPWSFISPSYSFSSNAL